MGINELLEHEMKLVRKGTFMMGALPDDHKATVLEQFRHEIKIEKDFYVGKYLVGQELWGAIMGKNPSRFKGEKHPVEQVSWFDCVKFCNKLSESKGLEPVYTIDDTNVTCDWEVKGYRLLTEAEWEYSARGGNYHLYAGNDDPEEVAWYRYNTGRTTHPVGEKKPNGYGLYDMSGNLEEWVWDYYHDKTYFKRRLATEAIVDPTGPETGKNRVTRGGSWFADSNFLRLSVRYSNPPESRLNIHGLRLALPS